MLVLVNEDVQILALVSLQHAALGNLGRAAVGRTR
jgi:hypothetical protein